MKIRDFLQGPFPPEFWLDWNKKHPDRAVLTRMYVVGFKGRHADPDGRAAEVLRRYRLLDASGSARACIAALDVVNGEWRGPPAPAVGRYVDVASSDALYDGLPLRCSERHAAPAVIDVVRLDVDLKPPPYAVRREGGRVKIVDRQSGAVVKEVSESRYDVKRVARELGVLPGALVEAERWGGSERPPPGVLSLHIRRIRERLGAKGFDAAFMLSGSKGFHVLFALERPVPAEWRPAIVRGLAAWLGVEVDGRALDARRKLRVPWTVNTETGELARFVDPETLEPLRDFAWPRPIPLAVAKTLAALYAESRVERPAPAPRRAGRWLDILLKIVEENPGLRHDCRRRLAGLWGCGCARDGIDVETCTSLFAGALGLGHVPHEYRRMIRDSHEVCAAALARGGKPLFSIKNALKCRREELWYCIAECLGAPGGQR
ncbi:MAG: hypothetical protein LM577_07555 [Thermoproteaceae archaeon]|nr:hypothetical protein [Thermoproteaceae archaeon]